MSNDKTLTDNVRQKVKEIMANAMLPYDDAMENTNCMENAQAVIDVLNKAGYMIVPKEPGDFVLSDDVKGCDSIADSDLRMKRLYRAMIAMAGID